MSLCTPAGAATQVSLSISILAQITGLSDISFPNVEVTNTAISSQSNCAWSNTLSRGYTVTATGNGTGQAFTLTSGSGTTPAYSVSWAGTANASSGTLLTAGTASPVFASSALVPGCTIGPTASSTLIVSIAPTDLQAMIGGRSYTGTLTLVIAPQ